MSSHIAHATAALQTAPAVAGKSGTSATSTTSTAQGAQSTQDQAKAAASPGTKVSISDAAKAALLKESTESAATTANEAQNGDLQAQKLVANQAARQAATTGKTGK